MEAIERVPTPMISRTHHRAFPIMAFALALGFWLCMPVHSFGQADWDTAKVWTDFEAALQRPENVLRLDLSRSKLKVLDHRLQRFQYLRELNLDKNKIDTLPNWIGSLSTLERLSIRSNRLRTIPPAMLQLYALKELDLADNEIEGIPEDIDHMVSLEKLILWSNVVGHFPPSLSRLEHLVELDLLHNEMSVDEQIWVREILPKAKLHFSAPCQCQFDD
jgi:hypothetical protein